jgi:hypothetical protein
MCLVLKKTLNAPQTKLFLHPWAIESRWYGTWLYVGGREETKTRQKFGYQLVKCRPPKSPKKCYGVQGNTWAKTQPKHQNYRGEGLKIYTVAGEGFASSVKLLIELAVTSSLAAANKLLLFKVLH